MDDDEERDLGRLFNLDAFSWMAMGIAVYNVIFALLGGFANESGMLYSAGASFVVMLLVVYLMSNRSRSSWTVGAIAFVGVFALGVAIVAPFTPYGEDPLFLVYGAIYVVLGPLGLAMLIGGRDQIQGPDGAAG
ncbi:hypothetical protein BRC83_05015 [Halobacteriales archaeon QS_1_68_17]|nr:MAG: hypothetical protein BRC83_05015 [Halobacteriales archaeon QS_1_68_17]